QPTEQAILRQTFPPREQGMAMALFGMAVVLGPAFGPTLGGYIVDNYSWPWIFYVEDPRPAIVINNIAAEGRPECRTKDHGHAEEGHGHSLLAWREGLAQDGL